FGLEKRARKEESQEHQEVHAEVSPDARPDNVAAHLVGGGGTFLLGLFRRSLGCRSGGNRCGRTLSGLCFSLVSHNRPGYLTEKLKNTNLEANQTNIYML